MPKVVPRDVSPLLQQLRNFLLGRSHVTTLRYENELASRSPPPPVLPDGPCHGLNKNYYYLRDVRREVKPPTLVASNKKAIAAGASPCPDPCKKPPKPGCVYLWD